METIDKIGVVVFHSENRRFPNVFVTDETSRRFQGDFQRPDRHGKTARADNFPTPRRGRSIPTCEVCEGKSGPRDTSAWGSKA